MTDLAINVADLDALVASQEDGRDVEILHPATGDPIGMTVRLAGPDSDRVKQARKRVTNARLRRKTRTLTADDIEFENQQVLADSIISWSGPLVTANNLDLTRDNAISLFKRWPFMREQLEAEAGERAGFTKS